MPRPSDTGNRGWQSALKEAHAGGDYNRARSILNQHGYKVPASGGSGWLYQQAYIYAMRGAGAGAYQRAAINLAERKGESTYKEIWRYFNGAAATAAGRGVAGQQMQEHNREKFVAWLKKHGTGTIDTKTPADMKRAADWYRAWRKKNPMHTIDMTTPADLKKAADAYRAWVEKKSGKGGGTTPGGGGTTPGTTGSGKGSTSVAPVDWKQFMIRNLQSPEQYARSLTNLEYNGALRDLNRLLVDEKRRGKNIDSWVNKAYDPMIQGLTDSMGRQDQFNQAQQDSYQQVAATTGDLIGNDPYNASAGMSGVVAANQGQLAALGQLQHAQNADAVSAGSRMKVLRRDELTDRSKDQLTALRDKMLGLRNDRRSAYNRYLMQAQQMRQQAISGAVDIAGALQNQRLAQAMSGYQLQQAALDTQAMADQIQFNRKQQNWTDQMNQAGLDNLTASGKGAKNGFIPWAQLVEGDRRTLIGSILEPWIGRDTNTGQPQLTVPAVNARQTVLNQLAAAGYAVYKNKNIGAWVDAYIASIPKGGYSSGDYWSGIGSALDNMY